MFDTTPRKPMMYFWKHDLSITGTANQRDNDHDGEQAEIHCEEIDNNLSRDNLISPNYVIDNSMGINFGGEITMILVDKVIGLWATSDGLSRNTKIFLLGLAFRNFATDKSIFDKYVFRDGSKVIRLIFIKEVGDFVDSGYKHTNKIVADIATRGLRIQDVIDEYYDPNLYNQNYFVLEQLERYRDWVKNHKFSDEELLIAYENILNLYQVSWAPSENSIDDFSINSGERGVPTNGISSIANKVLAKFKLKYLRRQSENTKLNLIINEKIKHILSPIRRRCKPIQSDVATILKWVIDSYYMTKNGGDQKSGKILDVVADEIMSVLDDEMIDYAERDEDNNIIYSSDDEKMLPHFDSALSNWGWYKNLKRINKYFDDGIINEDGKRWIPLLLKYQRVTKNDFTMREIRIIQNVHICGKFVSHKSFQKLLGRAAYEIDINTDISEILKKWFVKDNVIEVINFKHQLISSLLTKRVKSRTDSIGKKYNYLDNVMGICSNKNTHKKWVSIDPESSGYDEWEHFLAYKNPIRSSIRTTGVNFFSLDRTTNCICSDDPVELKIPIVRKLDNTLGQLFEPNDKLENNVKELLTQPEYNIFRNEFVDTFDDKEWVKVCSVGIIGDSVSAELPTNLIYKYKDAQADQYLKKVFGV
mgnify:FL=1|tara:strand:- start:14 stop:1951 length:1938 start_codon:yes stop_codon:yes gene_type:complete